MSQKSRVVCAVGGVDKKAYRMAVAVGDGIWAGGVFSGDFIQAISQILPG